MVQWAKNLTARAQVAAEVKVSFPAQHSGLKDLALLQLWHRLKLLVQIQSLAGKLPYAICHGCGHKNKKNREMKREYER